jgi:hypothetical protein
MKKDWHKTQNEEYLDLLFKRLKEEKLIWVQQFVDIINNFLDETKRKNISINEFGSNVGHFYRGVQDIKTEVDFIGHDISEVYLSIARQNFNKNCFINLDISNNKPREVDITVISATLEHISDHNAAIKNMLDSTKEMIILRTFVGKEYLEEYCLKDGAEEPYLIKQYTLEMLENHFNRFVWEMETEVDKATSGSIKKVCNEKNIQRSQQILIFKRK